jgi:hypothetical protein
MTRSGIRAPLFTALGLIVLAAHPPHSAVRLRLTETVFVRIRGYASIPGSVA